MKTSYLKLYQKMQWNKNGTAFRKILPTPNIILILYLDMN